MNGKWTYKILALEVPKDGDVERALNEAGADGWELDCIYEQHAYLKLVLKRLDVADSGFVVRS